MDAGAAEVPLGAALPGQRGERSSTRIRTKYPSHQFASRRSAAYFSQSRLLFLLRLSAPTLVDIPVRHASVYRRDAFRHEQGGAAVLRRRPRDERGGFRPTADPGVDAYRTLRFPLPGARIRALRFDPIDGSGTFSVRSAASRIRSGHRSAVFALSDLTPSIRSRAGPKRHQSSRSRRCRARQIPCFRSPSDRPIDFAPSRWQRVRAWRSNLPCACS